MPALWESWKKSLACKSEPGEVYDPRSVVESKPHNLFESRRLYRSGCSRSLANLRDVVHGSRRVFEKPINYSPRSVESSDLFQNMSHEAILHDNNLCNLKIDELEAYNSLYRRVGIGSGTPNRTPLRGTPTKRFAGCYDCSLAQNPASNKGASISSALTPLAQPVCQRCGEMFTRYEAFEQHHLTKHAVAELCVGDSSRNIIEIIFKTSWLKSEKPNLKIERVLKVDNLQKTLAKFEEYRDFVKTKASKLPKKHPRCLADGNELLRFYGTTFSCSLGLNGSSSLCSLATCNVCRLIRWGFTQRGEMARLMHTTATSGRAHDSIVTSTEEQSGPARKAMLVCRVIAGRVHKAYEGMETLSPPNGFDSVAGEVGRFANIEDLYVFNSKAILPCFVVIYKC